MNVKPPKSQLRPAETVLNSNIYCRQSIPDRVNSGRFEAWVAQLMDRPQYRFIDRTLTRLGSNKEEKTSRVTGLTDCSNIHYPIKYELMNVAYIKKIIS